MAMMAKKKAGAKAEMPMEKGGDAKKYAKGGSIDGIAQRGKTKGKNVTMMKGGKC
jgi:hypothetical protein